MQYGWPHTHTHTHTQTVNGLSSECIRSLNIKNEDIRGKCKGKVVPVI